MILRYEHGSLVEQRTHREALCFEDRVSPVISIAGAGGKTTTALHLAQDFIDAQIPVAVTTTTHMQIWNTPFFLLEESMEKLTEILEREKQVWFGIPAAKRGADGSLKMQSVSETFLEKVRKLRIPLIIEADGARRLPLKVPGEHEPVILRESTDVLSVYGLDAVGKPLREVCFRPEQAARLLGKKEEDIILWEDIALLAADERGGRKGVGKRQNYRVILNKADNAERIETARLICRALETRGITGSIVTSNAD